MRLRHSFYTVLGAALIVALYSAGTMASRQSSAALALASGTVTIAGTSNVHAYTASTTAVRVTRLQISRRAVEPNLLG